MWGFKDRLMYYTHLRRNTQSRIGLAAINRSSRLNCRSNTYKTVYVGGVWENDVHQFNEGNSSGNGMTCMAGVLDKWLLPVIRHYSTNYTPRSALGHASITVSEHEWNPQQLFNDAVGNYSTFLLAVYWNRHEVTHVNAFEGVNCSVF
jgi:hypothetical protein